MPAPVEVRRDVGQDVGGLIFSAARERDDVMLLRKRFSLFSRPRRFVLRHPHPRERMVGDDAATAKEWPSGFLASWFDRRQFVFSEPLLRCFPFPPGPREDLGGWSF